MDNNRMTAAYTRLWDAISGPPPAFVIRLEIEAAPVMRFECLNDSDERRLRDWLLSHPDLCALIDRAFELGE